MSTRTEIARLLRRATFGPRATDVDAAERVGIAATVEALLHPPAVDPGAARTPAPVLDPGTERKDKEAVRQVVAWWLDRMAAAENSATEKLIFFWHGHWATSVKKVGPALMLRQHGTLRANAAGDFRALARAMVTDPALLYWLDGQQNTKKAPNENLARELMELFTLGVGNFTEDDIKAGARVLTGWKIDKNSGDVALLPNQHDASPVTILGQTRAFTAESYVDLLVDQPACGKHLADRVGQFYGATPSPGTDIRALLASAWTHLAEDHVKTPVDWFVGACRQLGVRPSSLKGNPLAALGQIPLAPPNVGGWATGAAWLTTSAAQARLQVAGMLAEAANLSALEGLSPGQRPDYLARTLVVDAWSDRTRAALAGVSGNPRRLVTVALSSPEYLIS
ncbi:DUF1800 domain-containing protein [Longispora sp. K20-0274]|uniref:DUF1800 domain-containing protein n=1 Tax=Longispora sp. K20-0274 TaxID=3088255 RepID=UPI00399A0DD7